MYVYIEICVKVANIIWSMYVLIVSSGQESSQSEGVANEASGSTPAEEEEEYYNEIYFDSSDSDDGESVAEGIKKVGKKVRKMTNDELFYDPRMDEEDEKWMKRQRTSYLNGETEHALYSEEVGHNL